MLLISCGNTEERDIFNEPSFLILSNGSKVNLNVQYLRTEYFYDHENPFPCNITIVSSTNELEQYYENHRLRIWDGQGNLMPDEVFLKAIENYTDIYFNENILLIVGITEGSGSIRHKVDKIDENGNIFIKSISPEVGTADMASWSIIIELNKSMSQQNFKVTLVYVEKK